MSEDKALFLSPHFVEHEINGHLLKFHPVSVLHAFKLKTIAKPIAGALATFFAGWSEANVGKTIREFGSGTVDEGREAITTAIDPALAKLRQEQQDAALEKLVAALTDEKVLEIVGALITDSLRDAPDWSIAPSESTKRMRSMDVLTLSGYLTGLAKANARVFGPLGDRAAAILKVLGERLDGAARDLSQIPGLPTSS